MTCKECSNKDTCHICKSLELDTTEITFKFTCYNFKPINKECIYETDNQ